MRMAFIVLAASVTCCATGHADWGLPSIRWPHIEVPRFPNPIPPQRIDQRTRSTPIRILNSGVSNVQVCIFYGGRTVTGYYAVHPGTTRTIVVPATNDVYLWASVNGRHLRLNRPRRWIPRHRDQAFDLDWTGNLWNVRVRRQQVGAFDDNVLERLGFERSEFYRIPGDFRQGFHFSFR